MYQAMGLWAHGHTVAACLLSRLLADLILRDLVEPSPHIHDCSHSPEISDPLFQPSDIPVLDTDVIYCSEGAAYPAC